MPSIHSCTELIAKLDTTHFITNMRVNVTDSESKASATCSGARSALPRRHSIGAGAAHLLVGSLYWLDLARDDGMDYGK